MRFMSLKLFSLLFIVLMASACEDLDLDLEPDSSVNIVGDPHTVTLTAIGEGDDEEMPIVNELIIFRVVTGPNEGRESVPFNGECVPDDCRTDQNGQVTWTYTSQETGLDSIIAFLPIVVDDDVIVEAPSDTATKRWELGVRPIPTLSEWGLIAMAGVMGLIAFIVLRKKKLTA